jgi:hypothetical protein
MALTLHGAIAVKVDVPVLSTSGTILWSYVMQLGALVPEFVKVVSFLLLSWALFVAAMKIHTVYGIVREFNQARSPISELRNSVTGVKDSIDTLTPQMKNLRESAAVLNEHAPTIRELISRIDGLQRAIHLVQEEMGSQSGPVAVGDAAAPQSAAPPVREDEPNWQELRSIWRRNTQRLEKIIQYRLVGRRRRSYVDVSRSDYPAIMEGLKKDNVLSIAAHAASLELHKLFMSYKPRNRNIPDEVIGSARVLDVQLEELVGSFPVEGEDGATLRTPESRDAVAQKPATAGEPHAEPAGSTRA